MGKGVQKLLESFDQMPESDKREVVSEILRRTTSLDIPALSDQELVLSAEELFLELDRQEAQNEPS